MTSPRLDTIAYGGLTVGNGTSYELHDVHIAEHDYENLSCEWTVVFRSDTAAGLQTLDQAVVDALRTPNGDLVVTLNGTATINTSHSSNTGFNARGSCELIESHRSGNSKARRCRVDLIMPADESGKNFRRRSKTTITTDPQGFVTVTVEAEYTAGGSDSAQTNVSDNFSTFVTSVLPTLTASMVWDTTDEDVVIFDEENKVAQAFAVRRSIVHAQSSSGTDDADVVGADYSLSVFRPATPQLANSGARELIVVTCDFSWPVRVGQSVDLDGKFTSKILPYLSTMVSNETDAPATPVEDSETYRLSPDRNLITGSVTFTVAQSNLVQASKRVTDSVFFGDQLVPLADGGRWSKILQQGPGVWTRDVTIRTVEIGKRPTFHDKLLSEAKKAAEGAGFRLMAKPSEAAETFEIRTRNGLRTFTERATSLLFEYFEGGKSGGGGRGGGGRVGTVSRKALNARKIEQAAQTNQAG